MVSGCSSHRNGHPRSPSLGDILLLFIYLEIGAMIGIYFKTTQLPVRYLIYIAITALGRVLIEKVGAEHQTGMDLLVVSGAILLLSFAVLVLTTDAVTNSRPIAQRLDQAKNRQKR